MRPRLAFREVTDKERDPQNQGLGTLREPPFTQQSYQGVLGSFQTIWSFFMMIWKSQSSAAVLETLDICVTALNTRYLGTPGLGPFLVSCFNGCKTPGDPYNHNPSSQKLNSEQSPAVPKAPQQIAGLEIEQPGS